MSTLTLPTYTLTPDMFGAIAKDINVPEHDNTEPGLLKWIAETAVKQIGGSPDLSSKAVAERLQISRRTLEGYRRGGKVPLRVCWLLAALVRELRDSASGLVIRSTPSETATRDGATQLALDVGLVKVTDQVAKTVLDLAIAKKKPIKPSATKKPKPSSKLRNPSYKSKSPISSKSRPSSKTKSPSSKKRKPSSK